MSAPADTHPPLTTDVVTTGHLARRGQSLTPRVYRTVASTLHGIGVVFLHAWHRRATGRDRRRRDGSSLAATPANYFFNGLMLSDERLGLEAARSRTWKGS